MSVTVNFWDASIPYAGSGLNGLLGLDVGHSSMLIDSEYISFAPKDAVKKFEVKKSTLPKFIETLDEDIQIRGRKPNHQVNLFGLNERMMIERWSTIQEKEKYSLIKNNCSTIVGNLLEIGFAEHWKKLNLFDQENILKILRSKNLPYYLISQRDFFDATFYCVSPWAVFVFANLIKELLE